MKAMILAAGFGKRMQPFTNFLPKPLIEVNGKTLIARHLERLAQSGVKDVMINIAHLGDKIISHCGNGKRWGLNISYSTEPEDSPLETGGAVEQVLDWFEAKPFILVSADVWTDYPWESLPKTLSDNNLAHLILAKKPAWLAQGDFSLDLDTKVYIDKKSAYTYAGFGIMHPDLWQIQRGGSYPISILFNEAIAKKKITGTTFNGKWFNIGCEQRLIELCNNYGWTLQDTNLHSKALND